MNRKRTLVTSACLAAVIIAVGWLAVDTIYGSASAKTATRTTTVQLGSVQSTVTATGNVSPAGALSVNFQTSGTVTEIDVKAGDQVKAGQTLAKIDDTQAQAALSSARASLSSAQANLANVQQPLTAAVAAQDAAALQSGQQAVATAQSAVSSAQQSAALNVVGYQNAVNQALAQLNRDTNQYSADQSNCVTPTTSSSGAGGQSCSGQLTADQTAIAKDRDSVTNVNQQQATGQLKDLQSIQQAQNGLISAQDNLAATVAANNAKATATPASVTAAQAQVITAEANVVTAQKNEAATTLSAPSDGTVATLSGIVGQAVTGGGTAASSTSSSGAATGTSASSSSSSTFITLDNVSALQVVAGFAEADASKVQVGQTATISLNALPNQALDGQVSRVDVNSTVVSNVVTYNVTIALSNPPTGVKPGMTASVAVVVSQRDNVLNLPTADISTRGGAATVTLLRNGKQIVQAVSTGLVGDQTTEITSGVNEGDTVVTPTLSVTGSGTGTGATTRTGTGTGGIGGGGGLFGGGAGGGGVGGGG